MTFNKVTLSFPEKDEILFREKYFINSLLQFRLAFLILAFIYAAFGYLDTKIIPEFAVIFHSIRFYFVVPFLLVVLLLSYTSYFKRIWQLLLFASFIIGGGGIIIMTMIAPDNYPYYGGLILIFVAGYFFIKLRFFWATIAGWTTLLLFNVGAIFYSELSSVHLIGNNFFYISANLIGMFASYSIEYYTRRDFFLNQELDRQRGVVDDINKNLEKIVHERTSELLEARNKAEQSDRLKSAFLTNMSHEIRTPMNGILGFSGLLKEDGIESKVRREYINIIEESGIRMLNMITAIIDFSKIESGLMEVYKKPTNINEQIEYIYTFFEPESKKKKIQLNCRPGLPADDATIITDREKLIAILRNLVSNAINYTTDGSIEFGYNKKGDYLEFYVKDSGLGIPKEMEQLVFDRFIQTEISTKGAIEGAGLGLSISKAYVNMLGGKIWVESELDKGSEFYFTIPYELDEEMKRVNIGENHINKSKKQI